MKKPELKIINASVKISQDQPGNSDITYYHSLMCQVGLPRSKIDALEFERICGGAGLYLQAGKIWDGKQFVQQNLPYGSMPRLILAYLNTYAVRNNTPEIDIGNSASEFLKRLGKESTGGKTGSYTTFKKQLLALSACRITLGFNSENISMTYDGTPIKKFEAWLSNNDNQKALWPGLITFSEEYFKTLRDHAIPLDLRALNALQGSSLAMDIYTMLADRLHRLSSRGLLLHWYNLRDQFGQEYQGKEKDKNFKKAFLPAFKKALAVYPKADVKPVKGGLYLKSSPPPINYKTT